MKKLTAYVIGEHEMRFRPAPVERDWIDKTHEKFVYRCLPINIANSYGWELLCPFAFSALWDGGRDPHSIHIKSKPVDAPRIATSHFGYGILTFSAPALFRTDPGVDLFVGGPINRPKDSIAPLTGIVETDWSPYTFTVNWQFTRPNQRVHFEVGEPFCNIFPIVRGGLESVQPVRRHISDDPELEKEFIAWRDRRKTFNDDRSDPNSNASKEKWQKNYMRESNATRLRLKSFEEK